MWLKSQQIIDNMVKWFKFKHKGNTMRQRIIFEEIEPTFNVNAVDLTVLHERMSKNINIVKTVLSNV